MVAVLDQYEVEYKESYTSGTYDQVVMGKMFFLTQSIGKQKLYAYGNRGVVYGSINSDYAPTPGIGIFDLNNSVSYRSQPYKEKSGNCRAAKHHCYEERIYDTLSPDPLKCFKINGAQPLILTGGYATEPGLSDSSFGGAELQNNAIIMFDNYTPSYAGNRDKLNPAVDRIWTRSFPFEPRYSNVKRQLTQKFTSVEANYAASFYNSEFSTLLFKNAKASLVVGTIGPRFTLKQNTSAQSLNYLTGALTGANDKFYHHWAMDANTTNKVLDPGRGIYLTVTGSCSPTDLTKVLFGFGDANTVFYDTQFSNPNDPTGYLRRGTNNWPEFRINNRTDYNSGYNSIPNPIYEQKTGSYWCISPIIRGWKYGLYNGLPEYTSAYYRQGKYGQFRDLLEQRIYTSTINEKKSLDFPEGPVTVKFFDSNQMITDAVNTQSQNLDEHATSSLPYFDLEQRNRPIDSTITNLSIFNFNIDQLGNLTI